MFRRLLLVFSLVAMGLALDGCTKMRADLGRLRDQSPKSCKSDR